MDGEDDLLGFDCTLNLTGPVTSDMTQTYGIDVSEWISSVSTGLPPPGENSAKLEEIDPAFVDQVAQDVQRHYLIARRQRVPLVNIPNDEANMPGRFCFHVTFRDINSAKKNFEFDKDGKKLYVSPFKYVKMVCHVTNDGTLAHQGRLFMRLIPKFVHVHDEGKPVIRCPAHQKPDDPSNVGCTADVLGHMVRVEPSGDESTCVTYESEYVPGDERLSVVMNLPSGMHEITPGACASIHFSVKFTCFHSCRVSGINRQRIAVFFMLENESGECVGRQLIEVRACASPGRDYKSDMLKRPSGSSTSSGKAKKYKRPVYNPVMATTSQQNQTEARGSVFEIPVLSDHIQDTMNTLINQGVDM